MASLNRPVSVPTVQTFEGASVPKAPPLAELRRSVLACLLWEDSFYESGESIANRIKNLVPQVNHWDVARLAIKARSEFHLRHVPLLLANELSKLGKLNAWTLTQIIQRPDELTEFLKLYSLGRTGTKKLNKLSNQVKRGLADAFKKFNEYSLAKYNRKNEVKLRDVLRLVHPKPENVKQSVLWSRVLNDTLETPETWEVLLSKHGNTADIWTLLLAKQKLGGLAFLRNLRNMQQVGVPKSLVREYMQVANFDRVLPFRFIAAARAVPEWEDVLEEGMFKATAKLQRLAGRTVVVVDNSGSMNNPLSSKSDLSRRDAAAALAILIREISDDVHVISFSDRPASVPPRRGFALGDAIRDAVPVNGTDIGAAVNFANTKPYHRVIVITDEQSVTRVDYPRPNSFGYFINVASYQNGVGYGRWTTLTGFSENLISYIQESEASDAPVHKTFG